jgi:hypothetical protein
MCAILCLWLMCLISLFTNWFTSSFSPLASYVCCRKHLPGRVFYSLVGADCVFVMLLKCSAAPEFPTVQKIDLEAYQS